MDLNPWELCLKRATRMLSKHFTWLTQSTMKGEQTQGHTWSVLRHSSRLKRIASFLSSVSVYRLHRLGCRAPAQIMRCIHFKRVSLVHVDQLLHHMCAYAFTGCAEWEAGLALSEVLLNYSGLVQGEDEY